MPVTQFFRQISPGRTSPVDPEHSLKETAIVFGGDTAIARLTWQVILDSFPLVIS